MNPINIYEYATHAAIHEMAHSIDKEVLNMVASKKIGGWSAPVVVQNPCDENHLGGYKPKISNMGRSFLHELLAGMGEDEARRLLTHLNDCIVDKTFNISETIDNAIVEYHVTRE